ncbi:MAG TPA: hypothetical protein VH396_12715, partial [Chitinophagaceae bacterium]
IVSNGGGLPDAVGNAGLVFRRGEIRELIACMREILSNPKLEEKIRQAAPEHLIRHYSETVSKQYLSIIESTVEMGYNKANFKTCN